MTDNLRMHKVLHPFDQDVRGNGQFCPVFLKVEVTEDGRLSISGVIGPQPSGDCLGGAGQISMEYAHRNPADNDRRYDHPTQPSELRFTPGWTAEKWLDLLDIWEKWHLNDMRAYCEHQEALGWADLARKEVTFFHYTMESETCKIQEILKRSILFGVASGDPYPCTPAETRLLALDYSITLPFGTPPPAEYEPARTNPTETKTLGWLRPNEHPDGILTKPCPVCGYEYGTKWLKQDLPAEVMTFLESLPATDRTPARV